MKRQIRHNVFETNSSSTHSIVITRSNENLSIPKTMKANFGEFGWECATYADPEDKLSYLYTGIKGCYYDEPENELNRLKSMMKNFGIEVEWQENSGDFWEHGYVDHAGELNEFIEAVLSTDDTLKRFLFSDDSYILTGNDNSDYDCCGVGELSYEHDEYYKGN